MSVGGSCLVYSFSKTTATAYVRSLGILAASSGRQNKCCE